MTDTTWRPIATAPDGVPVETKIHGWQGVTTTHPTDRMQQVLVRRGTLWWLANGRMYVYYTPTHWRPV